MNKMNKNTQRFLGTMIGIAILVVAGLFYLNANKSIGAEIYPKPFTNLIGTRTASSTVGVGWYGAFAASTTYPIYVNGVDSASLVFTAVDASTTGAAIQISLLGSNDPECTTATTSTIFNQMTTGDIEWFDAGPYLSNATVISSFSNATTTIAWVNPMSGTHRVLNFVDLNINCLGVQVDASSTIIHASYRLQE